MRDGWGKRCNHHKGWMDGGMNGWREGGMDGWRDEWMEGGRDGWMDGGRDGWMDEGMNIRNQASSSCSSSSFLFQCK
jgi:hypothetical protein